MIYPERKSYRIKIFGVLLIISLLVSGCGSKESSKDSKQTIEETGKMIESSKEKVFLSEIYMILEAGEVYFLEHQGISEVLIADLIKDEATDKICELFQDPWTWDFCFIF